MNCFLYKASMLIIKANIRNVLCLGLILSLADPLFGQTSSLTDSLEVKQILVDDAQRLAILNTLAGNYLRNYPALTLEKAGQAFELGKKLQNDTAVAESLRHLALGYQNLMANSDTALQLCLKSKAIEEDIGNKRGLIHTYMVMATIYDDIGNHYKSIDYLSQAELLARETQDNVLLISVLNRKGTAYTSIDHHAEAVDVFKQALKIAKFNDYQLSLVQCHRAIGDYYQQLGNMALTRYHLHKAVSLSRKTGHSEEHAEALFQLGNYHIRQQQPDSALVYFDQSLTIRKKANDITGIADCLQQAGHSYMMMQDYSEALVKLNKSVELASRLNNKRQLRNSYDYLYHVHTSLGQLDRAMEYRDKYAAISELIYTEENERKMTEIVTKMELDKKEQELAYERKLLENKASQLSKVRKLNITLIIISIMLLAGLGYIIYLFRSKQLINRALRDANQNTTKQNNRLKELNATKDKLFSIIGHDLKSPLNSLTSFTQLLMQHSGRLSEEEIKKVARDLDKSVRNLLGVLENLLAWGRSQSGKMNYNPEKMDLTSIVYENFELLQQSAEAKHISLTYKGPGQVWVYADSNMINTVMRNLINNAIKFTNDHGMVKVIVDEWKDAVEIAVKDNGVGMSEEVMKNVFQTTSNHSTHGTSNEKGTGLGLILCKEFVEKNDGRLMVNSKIGEGSRFTFTLPSVQST